MAFEKFLRRPKSGRFIREDGGLENVADVAKRADDSNLLSSVDDGKVYQSFWYGELTSGSTVYFTQPVDPVGGVIRGIRFGGVFEEGPIIYEQYIGGTAGSTLETITGYNADRRAAVSINPILRVSSLTGGTLIDKSFGQTATSTAQRSSATLATSGIGGIYDETTPATFVLTNQGNGASTIALVWVWKERGDL